MAEDEGTPTPQPDKSKPWTLREFGGKTFWDWLHLLIVPLMLALVTVAFTWQQDARQHRIEDDRFRQAQKIENQRAEAEREIQDQRAQNDMLQAYLDQMGTLLLNRNLRSANADSNVRNVARARTLTTLAALDPYRKQKVMRFLNETKLIQASSPDGKPVISLSYAELEGVRLGHQGQQGSFDLKGIVLINADLRNVGMLNADIPGSNLSEADLSGAVLTNANLHGANLTGTDLTDADLTDTDLTDTDLTDAEVTNDQLEQAKSLEGATMPNGQKYEDWLKDKEGRGEE
jgi:uncharacterized protein YjbI with pentapeptide repeats